MFPTRQPSDMTVLLIVIPLMVLGVAIATVPVLLGSVREHRAVQSGRVETADSARQEADFWRRFLGRRRGHRLPVTPERLSDDEIARIGTLSEEENSVR